MNLWRPLSRIQYSGRRFLTQNLPPSEDPLKLFTRRLNWLLRHGAVPPVMTLRPDGFVRLGDVRNLGLFRNLLPGEFDELLARDESRSFKIISEYDPRVGADAPWIRARMGHSIKSVDWSVKRILTPEKVPMLVHRLDVETWMLARHHGIQPHPTDGLIHLQPVAATQKFGDETSDIYVFLDIPKMLAAGIPLWRSTRGGIAWLTTGDVNGVLPPQMFLEALQVQVDRQTQKMPSG
ncbi:KptA family-domain-containing protein [Mycena olivaceomarginata]|nr:KptA family-domain-containing protein [Mycena olivaceomarginata]